MSPLFNGATALTFALVLTVSPGGAVAADGGHGVRVHKLMSKPAKTKPSKQIPPHVHTAVAPHRHKVVLRKGQRVIVRFPGGVGRSLYRRRYPGIVRPWQDRRRGQKRSPFLNPEGLYTSKIYRRGSY